MSAFFAIRAGDRSFLFTDGAAYDRHGIVRGFSEKVTCAATVPFAITAVGNVDLGDKMKTFLAGQAEKFGVDDFIDTVLPAFLEELRETYAVAEMSGDNVVAIAIALWSPTRGIQHLGFQTAVDFGRPDIEPFTLRELGATAVRGPAFPLEKMSTLRPPQPGEGQTAFVREMGVTVLGWMREIKSSRFNEVGTEQYLVGGHVDMTTVDAAGARTERVHVWNDKIGQPINPYGAASTVVPFPENRAARRAAVSGARRWR